MYYIIMHRTQLLLEDWQYEALKAAAERQKVSLSQLVRDILSRALRGRGADGEPQALHAIEGIGADDGSRARDHDRFLYGRRKR
jgi:hypothetical protein